VLLHQLLRAAGIESQLVLVNTDWNIHEEMPTLDQFNHMIVRVPGLPGCEFVDPTSKVARPGELVPWSLAEKHALVLDAGKPELVKLPGRPTACAGVEVERTVEVGEEGGLSVDEQVRFTGYYAQWMRGFFIDQPRADFLKSVQQIFSRHGAYQVESVDFPDPSDPTAEAVMKISYQMDGGAEGKLTLPDVWERDYTELAFVKERKEAYEWKFPTRVTSVTTLVGREVSDGYLEGISGKIDNKYCVAAMEVERSAGAVRIRYSFKTEARVWPAEEYAPLRAAWGAARAGFGRHLELKPE